MTKHSREDIDRYFEFGIHIPKRLLYLSDNNEEGEVCAATNEYFIKGLTYLDGISDSPIIVHMCSRGGCWEEGIGIYDSIMSCRSHVTIIVWGAAFSMGSVILQAGDERLLSKHSSMMIHDGNEGMEKDAKSYEAWGRHSGVVRRQMYDIYLNKVKKKNPKN
jgi:ATP-dependent protease ClpP protease subunit